MKPNQTLNKFREIFSSLIFYLSILIFLIGFSFSDTPLNGGWYQQFMPDLSGASIRDIIFTDSLTGYAVTSIGGSNSYILKTTNRGDNWTTKFLHTQPFVRVEFINATTGFTNAFQTIFKTTNAGENWNPINLPSIFGDDMFVLSEDTIWLAMSESLTGGVFRTTNGGASWVRQLQLGSQNPNHIYMYNGRLGFIAKLQVYLRRTTNGGLTWDIDTTGSLSGFLDMYFVDSLTGWKASGDMRKTTNGGLNWFVQTLPHGGIIQTNGISSFSNISKDTIWANGGYVLYPNSQVRGLLNRTTNGGLNWLFQIPDTSIFITYFHTKFINRLNGWVSDNAPTEIHTTTGGDPIFYTGTKQISLKIPEEFKLFPNYPNPFNPTTVIKFQIKRLADLKLVVYDVTGKETAILADKEYKAGTYEVVFDGSNYSSGVYFYSLIVDGKLIETKRMVLVK